MHAVLFLLYLDERWHCFGAAIRGAIGYSVNEFELREFLKIVHL